MLAVGFSQLLGNRSFKAELLIGAMTIWGVLMLISRVRLGMHYPIDLFVAIISAWIVHFNYFLVSYRRKVCLTINNIKDRF